VDRANEEGHRVGMIRPITLWPFPTEEIIKIAESGLDFLTVELNTGQMVEDVRLAVNGRSKVEFAGYPPGYIPSPDEVYEEIMKRLKDKE
jgi:2-oxoglutarate ferredoxin oxidoreductase subunit alpha